MAAPKRDGISIARDSSDNSIVGFEINLRPEGITLFMPFTSIDPNMPVEDRTLLKQSPESFLRKYAQVMISTARARMQQGEIGTPEDLERFQAAERMRRDAEELTPEQARVLADLRTTKGGAEA